MARPAAAERMSRILAVVPWIAAQGRPRLDEVCQRFGIDRDELLADLAIVPFVGRYPYTPDLLVEVDVDDEHVEISYGNSFERPLRLTRDEGLALLAAGQAWSRVVGHDPEGPLSRGLSKLAAVVGGDTEEQLDVTLDDSGAEAAVPQLERAVTERRVVTLDYFSHTRGEATVRDVEPLRLFHSEGSWYLEAYCRSSQAERVFRLDRIREAHVTDETFSRSATGLEPTTFHAGPDLPRVVIEVTATGAWVAEQHPVEAVEHRSDGRMWVTLAVSAEPWLERLLLRLGPAGTVVEGPPALLDLGPAAASRLLSRYR